MNPAQVERRAGTDGGREIVDIAAGVVLTVAAVGALAYLIPYHTGPALSAYDVAPGFFPALAASAVLALAIGLVVIRIARYRGGPRDRAASVMVAEMSIWGAVAGSIMIGLQTIGFPATAALVIAIIMPLVGERTWWLVALVALLFPLFVDQMAWHVFTVEMP